MAYTPIDIYQVVQKLRPDVKFEPGNFALNAFVEAVTAAVAANGKANYDALTAAISGGLGVVGSYSYSATATGTYVPVTDAFFTPAVNGVYGIYVFAENTDGGATGGQLDVDFYQGATLLASNAMGVFGATTIMFGVSTFSGAIGTAGGAVTVHRGISAYSGGNSAYRITASAILFA